MKLQLKSLFIYGVITSSLLLLSTAQSAFACEESRGGGLIPVSIEKSIGSIPVQNSLLRSFDQGVSEQDYQYIRSRLLELYGTRAKVFGGKLVIKDLWKLGRVNASASRAINSWYVNMFGGLARVSHMTRDAYLHAICHELGHHFGGAPKKTFEGSEWSSAEAQSDYFATSKCFTEFVEIEDNTAWLELNSAVIPNHIAKQCEQTFSEEGIERAAVCKRSIYAAETLMKIISNLKKEAKEPSLREKELQITDQTMIMYPSTQCRLDTLVSGSLCKKPYWDMFSDSNEYDGACNAFENESLGSRPSCWYLPVN